MLTLHDDRVAVDARRVETRRMAIRFMVNLLADEAAAEQTKKLAWGSRGKFCSKRIHFGAFFSDFSNLREIVLARQNPKS